MIDYFYGLSPQTMALIATIFTWLATAAGAATVFFIRGEIKKSLLDGMLGFASGVMIAASFFSLLEPSIEMAIEQGQISWLPAALGFAAGGLFLYLMDRLVPHLHVTDDGPEGPDSNLKSSILLVLAITLHNIPEGLAVGVAFGAISSLGPSAVAGAWVLAMGMALQNFPEGMAVSIPLKKEGLSNWKAFNYGQISGAVEPIFGFLGALAVANIRPILPYALSFAAGAMIYVVAEELIPEAHCGEGDHSDVATAGVMIGFTIMMILDVALG